jgi:hypothetical protein
VGPSSLMAISLGAQEAALSALRDAITHAPAFLAVRAAVARDATPAAAFTAAGLWTPRESAQAARELPAPMVRQ